MKWELVKMVWVMLAGCIPFVSFVVERRVTAKARAALAT
jgi:integral membrane protein